MAKQSISDRNRGAVMLLVSLLVAGNSAAAETSSFLSMFRKKPSSPEQLELKAEHGPWLILAATLSGEDAQSQAVELANEIQTNMKIPAFVMHKPAKGSEILGVGERIITDQNGRLIPKQLSKKYANGVGTEAWAVLVGEFTSTEDPRLNDALEQIRFARLSGQYPSLIGSFDQPNSSEDRPDDAAWLVRKTRELIWWRSNREDNLQKGPMGAAFVTRNPLLPDDFFETPKVDDFVTKLNKQVEHSVLECPGKFTVRVASFRGFSVTGVGGDSESALTETSNALDRAAEQANQLTLALREKGVEAFQFHDRYGSYVMIGSFDEIGSEVDSVFQYNPDMVAIMKEYCGYRLVDAKDPRTGAVSRRRSLKSLNSIPFDLEGRPMAVPRPETKRIYGGSLLGGR